MNIQVFGLVGISYSNPALRPGVVPGDITWWSVIHVLADLKFMALFAMLFGAGICLIGDRRAADGKGFWKFWLWRMGLLAIIGLLHAYLVWFGDILFIYAICGVVVAGMRGLRARWQLGIGLALMTLGCLIWSGVGAFTELGLEMLDPEERNLAYYSEEDAEADIAACRSGYLGQLPHRAKNVLLWHLILIPSYMFWRVAGLMLIGMGLFRLRVFSGQKSGRFYLVAALSGILVGWAITLWGVAAYRNHDWDAGYVFFGGAWRNYWGSLLTALGYLAAVVGWVKKGEILRILQRIFAAIGRSALSNYLLQSFLATSLFYGHGLGWYDHLSYFQLYLVVIAIWIFQILLTLWWGQFFRQGPVEWLWRSAMMCQWLPIRR